MKNVVLLKFLRALIYGKRFLWWLFGRIGLALGAVFGPVFGFFAWLHYKFSYLFKKFGLSSTDAWWLRRSVMQIAVFAVVIVLALPQTKIYAKRDLSQVGRDTLAFSLVNSEERFSIEEIVAEDADTFVPDVNRQLGVVEADLFLPGSSAENIWQERELAGVLAGGTALGKPALLPGGRYTSGGTRSSAVEYIVQPGDSLGMIAYNFGVSVDTIKWENGLSSDRIRQGQKLVILPVTGLTHKIVKGDTLKKIAKAYGAQEKDIVEFNKLREDGSDLAVGEIITVPGGAKKSVSASRKPIITPLAGNVVRPPSSGAAPSAAGFVWPAGVRIVTQYYNWKHHAVDIAGGNFSTPIYAAKAGTVVTSQCGWNGGYGCYVILDHGGGVRTIYGHNSRNLVSVGDYVPTGETIALMGNTGNVRGRTGIHLHFEVLVNGVRKNPLSYVK